MKRPPSQPSQPSKQQILAFIGEQSGRVGTREIARAFGLKNADRAELKRTLRELADEGHVEKRKKKLHHPGTLPQVVLADIGSRDANGELIAVPTEWDEEAHGAVPVIHVATPRRARPGEVVAVIRKRGLDPAPFLDILTNTMFGGRAHKIYGAKILAESYAPGFRLPLALKDVRLALAEADSAGVPMPSVDVVHDRMITGIGRGYADLDWTALGLIAAEEAGLHGPLQPAAMQDQTAASPARAGKTT